MFSLNDSMRYWLYNRPTDMRKSYYTLSGIVINELGCDPCNGVNGNEKCTDFGNWECTDFGNNNAPISVTTIHNFR